jgi:hypothetical protein
MRLASCAFSSALSRATLPICLRYAPHRVDRDGELGVLADLPQRLRLLIPDEVLRAGTTWSVRLLSAR